MNHICVLVPTAPPNITFSQRTNSSLSLQWPTPYQMADAPNISYLITYQPQGGVLQNQVSSVNSTNLSLLLSGTLYNINVTTVGPQNLTSTVVMASNFTCKCQTKKVYCIYCCSLD